MKDDVRKYIYGALVVVVIGLLAWAGLVYVNACGMTLTCLRGQTPVQGTPIPTLIPATLPALEMESAPAASDSDTSRVAAQDLIGAWVEAGSSETEAFQFQDANGKTCEATFEDVRPLFVNSNLWYSGSLACTSCHSVDLAVSPAQLDLSSYDGILAGSRRADDAPKGTDILGGGDWKSSLLYQFITESHPDIPGHDAALLSGLTVSAGTSLPEANVTPTP